MKKSILLFCLVVMLSANISGCAYYAKGPWKGRVLDAETKEPIEGAAVIIYWDETYFNVVERNSTFLFAKEFLTDADGRFDIPSQSIQSRKRTGTISGPNWFIYKNGFRLYPWEATETTEDMFYNRESTVYLVKGVTKEDRLTMIRNAEMFLPVSDITIATQAIRLMNMERVDLGLKPVHFEGEK